MNKTILTFGSILSVLLVGNMIYSVNRLYNNPTMEGNQVLGYTIMIVIFSMVFFGIRNLRNNHLDGKISFLKGLKAGALIALIGSTMYVVASLFYYYLFVPDFIDKYITFVLTDATRNGATEIELAAKTEQMSQLKEQFKNPLFATLMTYLEVLPLGLIVSLVSALILKKK